MIKRYCKRPVTIHAIQWTGENTLEVVEFCHKFQVREKVDVYQSKYKLEIETLEGTINASVGDFIIKGVKGEVYPCKPDIFNLTYEIVE